MIPITRVKIGEEERELVLDVLDRGHLAQGPLVAAFEDRCADMAGVEHAVAVNNGTTALVLAIEASGIGPGDEVVTSPLTFVATVNAILEAGATVRFGDVGDDYNLDPTTVPGVLTERTRAIMPVHLYGQAADMGAFKDLADEHGLGLIEDAAQAHFATTAEGRPVGSYGLGCFSFYATKNLMAGEGGVITTDDADIADGMRVLRNQGMRARYEYVTAGHNYRLTDLAAAVALPQFDRIATLTEARRRNADRLNEGLADLPGLITPTPTAGHVWHQYTVRLTDEAALDRKDLMARLEAGGVGHGIYYPRAVYDYECYRTHPRVVIEPSPVAEAYAASVLSLPVHPYLTDDDLNQIISVVREALDG